MNSELSVQTSVTPSPLQTSNKSGQQAAPLLSAGSEEQRVIDAKSDSRKGENPPSSPMSVTDMENEVQKLQEFGQLQGWTVNFSLEKDLNQVVIKVVDADTKSMIRQIPSEELLAISKRIRAYQEEGMSGTSGSRTGLLLDNEI